MIQNYPTCAISGHGRGGDIQVLYEKDLLGSSTEEALLNMVWFNNTIHFGLRGWKEHREMCWGDVKLCQTSTRQVSTSNSMKEKPKLVQETILGM